MKKATLIVTFSLISILYFTQNANALIVNSPPSVAGYMQSTITFDFGKYPPPPGTPGYENNNLVLSQPENGCGSITNAAQVAGKFVLVVRGLCFFNEKVLNAQNAGALGVVVVNNRDGSDLTGGNDYMVGADPTITIPSVMVRLINGQKLLDLLRANTPVTVSMVSVPALPAEKTALREFYTATGGPTSWKATSSDGWGDFSTDPCTTKWHGVGCDMQGHIIYIELDNYGLQGKIPASFGNMTKLTIAIVTNHPLMGGELPNVFQKMTQLEQFTFKANNFTGELPPSLLTRSTLRLLDLDQNQFTGTLPDLSSVTSLMRFTLDRNNIQGSIPSAVATFENIQIFTASNNKLTGSLPDLTASDTLTTIDFSYNQLSGTLKQNFVNTVALQNLRLRSNSFTGPLPSTIYNISTVDLANNQFEGTLPATLESDKLVNLDLSFNPLLTGAIPTLVTPHLYSLKLANTSLTGPFPDIDESTIALVHLDLSNLDLQSSLLDFLATLVPSYPVLSILKLSNTRLTGSLNDLDGIVGTVLSTIDLSRNFLYGAPKFVSLTDYIAYIDVSYNQLNGSIPNDLNAATSLYYFNAEGNPALKMENTPLPGWLTVNYDSITIDNRLNHYCPDIVGANRLMSVRIDRTYNNYYSCLCSRDYVRLNGTCQTCPKYGICPGGVKEKSVVIPSGYYPFPSPETPIVIARCRNASIALNPCNPRTEEQFKCEDGYQGRFCSDCINGYFHLGNECLKCGGSTEWVAFGLMIAVGVFFILYVMIVQTSQWRRGTFSILVFYLQTASFLIGSGTFPILQKVKGLNSTYSVAFFRLVGIECWAKHSAGSYMSRFFVIIAAPLFAVVGALMILAFGHALVKIKKDWQNRISKGSDVGTKLFLGTAFSNTNVPLAERVKLGFKVWSFRVIVYSYKLLHFPICVKIFSVFNCVADPYTSEGFLNDALWISCDSNNITLMRGFAILGIILYVCVVFFVVFFMLYWHRPNKITERVEKDKPISWLNIEMQVLHLCYKPEFYWVEIYFMIRRLALALTTSLIDDESAVRYAVLLIILLIALVVHSYVRPFASNVDNNLELLSLSVITISYLISVLVANIGFSNTGNEVAQWFLFVGNIVLVIFLVLCILYNGRQWWSDMLHLPRIPDIPDLPSPPSLESIVNKIGRRLGYDMSSSYGEEVPMHERENQNSTPPSTNHSSANTPAPARLDVEVFDEPQY